MLYMNLPFFLYIRDVWGTTSLNSHALNAIVFHLYNTVDEASMSKSCGDPNTT